MLIALFDWLSGIGITRDRLLALVSVLAFIMSSLTWIMAFVRQRKRVSIKANVYELRVDVHIFHLSIENKSRLPIAISLISVSDARIRLECDIVPAMVYSKAIRVKDEIVEQRKYDSFSFPINIPALASVSGFLVFRDIQPNPKAFSTEVTFRLFSNRGRPVKKKLSLPDLQLDDLVNKPR